MGTEVGGLEEDVESLADAISPNTVLQWTSTIQKTIQQQCDKSLTFKGILDDGGHFNIEFEGNSDDIDCLVRSIKQHLDAMHPMTRAFFERLIEVYETDRGPEDTYRP